MTRGKFTKYMVEAGAGKHVKFSRLTDSERCAHFLGVLSIASQAPIRGCLLVGDQDAEAIEIAHEARVTEKVAQSTLRKLKAVGVLVRDDELDCWRVHDWKLEHHASLGTLARNAIRASRKREAAGRYTKAQLADRIAFYGGVCWICRSAPATAIDHVKPLSKGGSTWPANLRPACKPCNSRKGARWPYEASA